MKIWNGAAGEKKRHLIAILWILCLQTSLVFAQQVRFTAINPRLDKRINAFLAITQDRLGYVWLSSFKAGLFKYDGSEFINFLHSDSNANSLASDWTEAVYADPDNQIWIGTMDKGLDRYDQTTNKFTHFRHDPKNSKSLISDSVTAVLEDHLGNLWIGTLAGLDLMNKKTGECTHFQNTAQDPGSLSFNRVWKIYEDRQGTLWVGCGSISFTRSESMENGGLNRFNRGTQNFTRYMHNPADPNSVATNMITALFEDSRGNFWVGTTENGLHIMNREKGTFTHYYYDPQHPENLSRPHYLKNTPDNITFIREDLRGGIWIGSLFNGINRYDTATRKITHYGITLDDAGKNIGKSDTASGFAEFSTWDALFSKDGMIWITVFRSFINQIYSASLFQQTVPFYTINKTGANTFYYGKDSTFWIGTNNGLLIKNLALKTEKYLTHDPKNINSLIDTTVTVIRKDRDNYFWIATFGGLDKFDPQLNTYRHYRHDASNHASLSSNTIWSMCLDHNNDLWLGTTKGLDKLDRKNENFSHFGRKGIIYCIREGPDNELWIASDSGIYKINILTGKLTSVFDHASSTSLCIDSRKQVWIGADTLRTGEQSLYRYDPQNNQLISFVDPNTRQHLGGVFDIMEDDHHNLWISTAEAILKINSSRDTLRRYGSSFGVHRNIFVNGDNLKAPNGLLFFGDLKGYYSFLPEELTLSLPPKLNMTSFKINDEEIIPGEGSILTQPIWDTREIRLSYDQNNFSFDFAGLNYQVAGDVKFIYMMENYDNAWHKYGTERRAYFFNMPPGNYIFRVKAINQVGDFSEKDITVIISPPWWKTWWAYTIFGLLFIGMIWGVIDYRSKHLIRENKQLEEKVTSRTAELNQSIQELKATQGQLIQSEKMASLGELTAGIAHEIQNPLNFVNNFSEVNTELISEMKEEIKKGNYEEVALLADDISENEQKIIHHGKRADMIVKGMLQHSRKSSGQKEPADLNALADEYLRLSYHGLRAKDKFMNTSMETDFDPSLGNVSIIPQDIGRVLLNLFNNAFYSVTEKKKEQPTGYDPHVFVRTRKKENFAIIQVRDNGGGVPRSILDKIFQPFFTTKPTGSGTGLGLSLSYDIIKAHGGELKVETREGEGAEFIITLPLV